jgi:hypothetical protein
MRRGPPGQQNLQSFIAGRRPECSEPPSNVGINHAVNARETTIEHSNPGDKVLSHSIDFESGANARGPRAKDSGPQFAAHHPFEKRHPGDDRRL